MTGGLGGRFIFHHAIWITVDAEGNPSNFGGWPVHEVGRNADHFDPLAGRLLKAGDQVFFNSVHMHANGEETTAHLRLGFKFHPRGFEPQRRVLPLVFGNGEIDLRAMEADQQVHLYATLQEHTKLSTFEPHMHAAGVRMCLEAIWGGRTETLSCAGYDHNWVKVYKYGDDAAPLLPKGTLLHVTAYFDNTPSNKNVIDPRNWGGLGHRSIDNMAILIAPALALTDEQFAEGGWPRAARRLGLTAGESVLGCPLCGFEELPAAARGPEPAVARRPRSRDAGGRPAGRASIRRGCAPSPRCPLAGTPSPRAALAEVRRAPQPRVGVTGDRSPVRGATTPPPSQTVQRFRASAGRHPTSCCGSRCHSRRTNSPLTMVDERKARSSQKMRASTLRFRSARASSPRTAGG